MTHLSSTHSINGERKHIETLEIDHKDHLKSLSAALLKLQATMNIYLTEEIKRETGVQTVEEEPDKLEGEE